MSDNPKPVAVSTEESKRTNLVMSWTMLLRIASDCNDISASQGKEAVVAMGLGAWTLAREVFEERLRVPFVADAALIDGVRFYCSLLVDPPNVMLLPREATERTIPLLVTPTANEGVFSGD